MNLFQKVQSIPPCKVSLTSVSTLWLCLAAGERRTWFGQVREQLPEYCTFQAMHRHLP